MNLNRSNAISIFMKQVRVDVFDMAEFFQYMKDGGDCGRNTKEIKKRYPNDTSPSMLIAIREEFFESELGKKFPGIPYSEEMGDGRRHVYVRFRITPEGETHLQRMLDGVEDRYWSYSEVDMPKFAKQLEGAMNVLLGNEKPPIIKIDVPGKKDKGEIGYNLPDWFFENL